VPLVLNVVAALWVVRLLAPDLSFLQPSRRRPLDVAAVAAVVVALLPTCRGSSSSAWSTRSTWRWCSRPSWPPAALGPAGRCSAGRGRAGAGTGGEVAELCGERASGTSGWSPAFHPGEHPPRHARRRGRGLPPLTTHLVYVLELR
jgi:hypothetical protein